MNFQTKSALFVFVILLATLQGCVGALVAGAGGAGAAIATDRRTAGTVVEDQSIEIKIANSVASDPEMKDKVHFNVTSFNNVVLLTGEAPTEELRKTIEQYARDTEKVRKVYNEIRIDNPSPLEQRNMDTWITTKVKTKLLGTAGIRVNHIKVVTAAQQVYLMGLVTRTEADVAAQAAADVKGVNQVIKTFEYLD